MSQSPSQFDVSSLNGAQQVLVTVNNNSPIQDYVHPDNQTQPFVKTESWLFKNWNQVDNAIHWMNLYPLDNTTGFTG